MFLPTNGVVMLSSAHGQHMLNETLSYNKNMIKYYHPQKPMGLSGPASLALLISAINTAYRIQLSQYRYNSPPYQELLKRLISGEPLQMSTEDVLNVKDVKSYFSDNGIDVQKNGLTLQQLRSIANRLKFGVNTYYILSKTVKLSETKSKELENILQASGDQLKIDSLADFRNKLSSFFVQQTHVPAGYIVNYDRSVLGLNGPSGHFSPVASYDKKEDRVLIMDMGDQPIWVKTELLYNAMGALDQSSGLPCGMVHIYELL